MKEVKETLRYIWERTNDFAQRADMFLLALSCICSIFGIVLIASAIKALPGAHTQVPVQIFSFFLGLFLYYIFTVTPSPPAFNLCQLQDLFQ